MKLVFKFFAIYVVSTVVLFFVLSTMRLIGVVTEYVGYSSSDNNEFIIKDDSNRQSEDKQMDSNTDHGVSLNYFKKDKITNFNIPKTGGIESNIINKFLPRHANSERYVIFDLEKGCDLIYIQRGIVNTYLFSLLTNRTFGIRIHKECPFGDYFRPNLVNWKIHPDAYKSLTHKFYPEMINFHFKSYAVLRYCNLHKQYPEQVVFLGDVNDRLNDIRRHPWCMTTLPWIGTLGNSEIFKIILSMLLSNNIDKPIISKSETIIKSLTKGKELICASIDSVRSVSRDGEDDLPSVITWAKVWEFLDEIAMSNRSYVTVMSGSNIKHIMDFAYRRYGSVLSNIGNSLAEANAYNADDTSRTTWHRQMLFDIFRQNLFQICDTLLITSGDFNEISVQLRRNFYTLFCFVNGRVLSCNSALVNNVFDS